MKPRYMRLFPNRVLSLATVFVAVCSHAAAVTITSIGAVYAQDFNTLAASGTGADLPADWSFAESGDNTNGLFTAGTGSSATGDTYSFGVDADRALGGLQSGSLLPLFGVYFENRSGGLIDTLEIAYTGEQWRLGAVDRADRLDFQYSVDATSLTTGTWTEWDALDFLAPTAAAGVGIRNGNLDANRVAVAAAITGLTLVDEARIWLRWSDFDAAGRDDGLAIDDFRLVANGPVPSPGAAVPDSVPMAACLGAVLLGLVAVQHGGVGRRISER